MSSETDRTSGTIVVGVDGSPSSGQALRWPARQAQLIGDELHASDAEQVHQHVVEGHPAPVLLDVAADTDLFVAGSRGHGGFAGMLLGSVSQHVGTHARCPVVVVHDTTPEQTRA